MRPIIVVSCVILGWWSSNSLAVDDNQVQQSIEMAKEVFNKAVAEQGGWMSTKKLINSAELNATKGDLKKAQQLAEKAGREAELSHQEALNQKSNWSEPAYLK